MMSAFWIESERTDFFCIEELREPVKGCNISTLKLDEAIDFEMFRNELEMALNSHFLEAAHETNS